MVVGDDSGVSIGVAGCELLGAHSLEVGGGEISIGEFVSGVIGVLGSTSSYALFLC